jgi:hypothetical protein
VGKKQTVKPREEMLSDIKKEISYRKGKKSDPEGKV